eukprot:375927-Pyramimonas_sp.AAC.1
MSSVTQLFKCIRHRAVLAFGESRFFSDTFDHNLPAMLGGQRFLCELAHDDIEVVFGVAVDE